MVCGIISLVGCLSHFLSFDSWIHFLISSRRSCHGEKLGKSRLTRPKSAFFLRFRTPLGFQWGFSLFRHRRPWWRNESQPHYISGSVTHVALTGKDFIGPLYPSWRSISVIPFDILGDVVRDLNQFIVFSLLVVTITARLEVLHHIIRRVQDITGTSSAKLSWRPTKK